VIVVFRHLRALSGRVGRVSGRGQIVLAPQKNRRHLHNPRGLAHLAQNEPVRFGSQSLFGSLDRLVE
jgi:hypothetical protein